MAKNVHLGSEGDRGKFGMSTGGSGSLVVDPSLGLALQTRAAWDKIGESEGVLFTLAWPWCSPTHSKRVLREVFSLKREFNTFLPWENGFPLT